VEAIAQKQSALTGEIFNPKPDSFHPQPFFQNGFPNYEASSPIRQRPSAPNSNWASSRRTITSRPPRPRRRRLQHRRSKIKPTVMKKRNLPRIPPPPLEGPCIKKHFESMWQILWGKTHLATDLREF